MFGQGKLDEAVPVLKAALKTAEVAKGTHSREIVPCISALAELQVLRRREEEAIVLLKRAYTLDKEALGPDAAEVGQHLIGLGGAYHQQGKLEAASLTLEEARSILVYALGPDAAQVQDVAARIKQLSVIEVDTSLMSGGGGGGGGGAATPRTAAKSALQKRMEQRLKQKERRTGELTKEDMERKQTEADLRRNGLLSARGGKAGDHFIHAAEVAMSATSEKEKRATGERKDLLQKKKALFRERLAQRKRSGNADDDSDEDEEGEGEAEEDREEVMAAVEAEMVAVLGRSSRAAQTEGWAEVVDCATRMEELMAGCRKKANGSACALRVLRSGLKTVGGDEGRARSALAVMMVVEWCVQQCDASFRHALGGERWVRRLVELARRDETEQQLVRTTVTQLLVNWRTWYSGGGTMFEMGVEMLAREGYQLPEPTRMQDGSETPRGNTSAAGGGAGMPVLLGQVGGGGLGVAAAAAAPSAAQA